MTFPRVVSESGLTKSELAYLYGVSRQTIYDWMEGTEARAPSRKASYTLRIAETITKAIMVAINRKILPLAPMAREARKKRVDAMAKTLAGLKPAPIK